MKLYQMLTAVASLALMSGGASAMQRNIEPGQPPHQAARIAQPAIIHAGTLLAVPGERARRQATLVTQGGRVVAIHDGFRDAASLGLPTGTQVVDLSSKFVMPGFIDLHVHLTSGGIVGRNPGLRIRQPDEFYTLGAFSNAFDTLMAGFTTLRDLGSPGDSVFALRDAIKMGIVPGPNLVVSGGAISPTNGHGDAHGMRRDLLETQVRPGVCDGADDCRRAVRNAVKYGADVIKVTVTGGVLSDSNSGTGQQFTNEELKAIAETAHALGRKVTTHAHDKQGIDAAVRAGYDSIEHGMWADDETLKLMKQHGTWLVPTVWPISWVGTTPEAMRRGPFKDLPPNSMEKLIRLGSQPKKLVRDAIRIGTPVALGTDTGINPHGTNAQEFLEYVDAGMSPVEALKTGTGNAAAAAGLADRGRIAPGMAADVIALDGDPTADINAVLDVDFVMRDGIIFKRNGSEVKE